MKLGYTFLLLVILFAIACTSSSKLPQSQLYSPQTTGLNMAFPGQLQANLEYDQFGSLTKKTYQRYLNKLAPDQRDKLLYYARTVDVPEKTPYTALGKLLLNLDTTQIKNQGFVNRIINDQPYLHKKTVDRTRKLIASEYLVKVDSGYFYLFSYAPIRHLLHNEEDVIIAQDSLNRKYSAIIGSFRKR